MEMLRTMHEMFSGSEDIFEIVRAGDRPDSK